MARSAAAVRSLEHRLQAVSRLGKSRCFQTAFRCGLGATGHGVREPPPTTGQHLFENALEFANPVAGKPRVAEPPAEPQVGGGCKVATFSSSVCNPQNPPSWPCSGSGRERTL